MEEEFLQCLKGGGNLLAESQQVYRKKKHNPLKITRDVVYPCFWQAFSNYLIISMPQVERKGK